MNKAENFVKGLTLRDLAKLGGVFSSVSAVTILTIVVIISEVNILTGNISVFTYTYGPYSNIILPTFMLAAIVGVPFLILLMFNSKNIFEWIGSTLFLLSTLAFFFNSYYPLEVYPEHVFAAILWMSFMIFSQFFYGTGRILNDDKELGLKIIWLGIFALTFWVTWAAWRVFAPGLFLPEYFGGALPYGIYAFVLSVKLYKDEL